MNPFRNKRKITSIKKYEPYSNKSKMQYDYLSKELRNIEKEIADVSNNLIQGLLIILRSTFARNKNWINKLQSNFYQPAVQKSIDWHFKELKRLSKKKKVVENSFYKVQGIYWQKQVEKLIKIFLVTIMFLFCIGIVILGVMTTIYILPILILFVVLYLLSQGKVNWTK